MNVVRINPVLDERWKAFVESHPDAGIFHTKAWLEALQRTYKYEPTAYAVEDGNQFVSGIPFCAVISFITGRRLVSLPFSDHCQPLLARPEHFRQLMTAVQNDAQGSRFKYVEIRPLQAPRLEASTGFTATDRVVVHKLDISRSEKDLLQSFHVNSIRRNIVKAARGQLQYEEGRSEDLLHKFYQLLLRTRRRHGIPPQPLKWFRNLIDCLGERLRICVASKDETPVASILTLSFNKTIAYKYSCSDPEYNSLGGSIFLLWQSIRHAKEHGLAEFDLGRSDYSTPGLITFKDRWGAAQTPVSYYRAGSSAPRSASRLTAVAKRLLTSVPDPMFSALGGLLYRHVG